MTGSRRVLMVAITFMLVGAVVIAQQRTADVALRAAMETETVKGDLRAAIEQYRKISQGADRAVAAIALVRMAECYQKLGDAEARKIWEQIVREYADQRDAAATARARLGAAPSNAGPVTRQLWTGPKVDAYGSVSPDGRLLSFTDWDTGDLAVHDLTTGRDRRLTNMGTGSGEWAYTSAISRDGKQVAYGWMLEGTGDLRLVDVNGGQPRILVAAITGVNIAPLDWSPDGKWLAVQRQKPDHTYDIGLTATTDGAFRLLKSVGRPPAGPSRISFSPDGKYVACDESAKDHPDRREIHLLAVDGGADTPLLTPSANDRVLGWARDGRLLFASERSGLPGVWAQMTIDGKPHGAPELLKANINAHSLGLTRAGALYYSVVASAPNIYVASVDFASGKVIAGPTPLPQSYIGRNGLPQWSHDGRHLAYLSRRDANTRNGMLNTLVVRSTDTGQIRELHPNLLMLNAQAGQPLWAPDGGSVLVTAIDNEGRQGIYRVDARNGDATAVLLGSREQDIGTREWSRDGRMLYLVRSEGQPIVQRLFARDIQSGRQSEVLRGDASRNYVTIGRVALSPDGGQLVLTAFDRNGGSLLVLPAEGGVPREVLRLSNSGPDSLGVLAEWSPDGKYLLFRKGPAARRETFRIPAEGGTAIRFGAEWTSRPHSINSDGWQVAFEMGRHSIEIWAMENFLPSTAPKK